MAAISEPGYGERPSTSRPPAKISTDDGEVAAILGAHVRSRRKVTTPAGRLTMEESGGILGPVGEQESTADSLAGQDGNAHAKYIDPDLLTMPPTPTWIDPRRQEPATDSLRSGRECLAKYV